MRTILISWIGKHDLTASQSGELGPVFAAIQDAATKGRPFSKVHLLCNYSEEPTENYKAWLLSNLGADVELSLRRVSLSSPTAYAEIYPVAFNELKNLSQRYADFQKYVHLSPGTPAMTAVWVLLVKTYFPAVCLESWLDRTGSQKVQQIELPFEIAAEYSIGAIKQANDRLMSLEFSRPKLAGIIGESELMLSVMKKAERMAIREVPVLILGETGTGKEVFAKAIHDASSRKDKPFVAVNCGTLPDDLAESLLFGHKKGAFTGAYQDHDGFFLQADGGTLFLDEVGELSPILQTKLLRVLQEKEFTQLGGAELKKSDFRIIAATHRNLTDMISDGSFREDLFYRVAIGILKLPPVRERLGDIKLLADAMMESINEEMADQPGYQKKHLSGDAHNFIMTQAWPGNVRELRATILRAALWSDRALISADEIEVSVIKRKVASDILPVFLGEGLNLNNVIGKVASHHIDLALKETNGNKLAAAKKLGLKSSQVLDNWVKKYGLVNKVSQGI